MRPLLMLLVAGCHCPPEAPPSQPPDVVLVVVDTLRADVLPVYGNPDPTSPTIGALAEEALVYNQAFAHSGWTLPSMGSIFTGRLPHQHGATRDPDDAQRFSRLEEGMPTLATLLADAGYRTGAFVNNVFMAPEFQLDRGFHRYDYVGPSRTSRRSAATTIRAALEWLEESEAPSFLFIHLMEPHLPYQPSPENRGRFTGPDPVIGMPFGLRNELERLSSGEWVPTEEERAAVKAMYQEEVLTTDDALGELVASLKARERWSETLLALTSDHGEEFWDHDGFEHGHTLYGELVRVPLIIRGPGFSAGRHSYPVQHVDLFQTILDLSGAPVPEGTRGVDLRQAPRGARPILHEDCLYGPPRVAVTLGSHRLVLNLESRTGGVFTLDEHGQADSRVVDEAMVEALKPDLLRAALHLRGDLEKHEASSTTAPLDDDSLDKLRYLGYID